jgi:asparagine synthase (glutamine-hydrolysing)
MCGIAGILTWHSSGLPLCNSIRAMANSMSTRGPDDEGYALKTPHSNWSHYRGPATPATIPEERLPPLNSSLHDRRFQIALGHRRLSILDITDAGHQPMASNCGRHLIVYNGEIYNFRELKTELQGHGFSFSTQTDTEVLLAAYSHWGENCVTHLNGDFAFAIWDKSSNNLFCARDRLGIKPFYYVRTPECFLFASDIKALVASGLYRPEPDPEGLFLAMAFGIAPRPITAFKEIKALPQGHTLTIDESGSPTLSRYWSIPTDTQVHNLAFDEAFELLEHELENAVTRRLVSDVPLACFLSGGIDSTLMTALAARSAGTLTGFTLGLPEAHSDQHELANATALAKRHRVDHIIHRMNPEELRHDFPVWTEGFEEPCGHAPANYFLSKSVSSYGIRVALNGLGGDELFGGYHWYSYRNFPIQRGSKVLSLAASLMPEGGLRKALSLPNASTPTQLHTILFQRNSDTLLKNIFSQHLWPSRSTPEIIDDLYAKERTFTDRTEAFNYLDLMNYVGNHHVHRTDQFTMACSLEGRFPLLDHNLIEAAFKVPSHLKVAGGHRKIILKKIAKKHIPESCITMPKRGFTVPLKAWVERDLRDFTQKNLESLIDRPEMNSAQIRRFSQAFRARKLNPLLAWHLCALQLWFERFIDPGVPSIT